MIKNQMEEFVLTVLNKELAGNSSSYQGLCTCPDCLATMQAIALNVLTPFYVTCVVGKVYGEFRNKDLQNYSDVLVAVIKGIETVASSGIHSKNKV